MRNRLSAPVHIGAHAQQLLQDQAADVAGGAGDQHAAAGEGGGHQNGLCHSARGCRLSGWLHRAAIAHYRAPHMQTLIKVLQRLMFGPLGIEVQYGHRLALADWCCVGTF